MGWNKVFLKSIAPRACGFDPRRRYLTDFQWFEMEKSGDAMG